MARSSKHAKKAKAPKSGFSKPHKVFHELVSEWHRHVRKEIELHKEFAKGHRHLARHIAGTVRIHRDFLKAVGKLSKKL